MSDRTGLPKNYDSDITREPGCSDCDSGQGCTYHGTLPTDYCEPHVVKNCSICNPGMICEPDCDHTMHEGIDPNSPDYGHNPSNGPYLTRPVTVHDKGLGGSDITYEAEAIPAVATAQEWRDVIDHLDETGRRDLAQIFAEQLANELPEQASPPPVCTYSFIAGKHIRLCPVGWTDDQKGLTE